MHSRGLPDRVDAESRYEPCQPVLTADVCEQFTTMLVGFSRPKFAYGGQGDGTGRQVTVAPKGM